jgi:simple sugar transport system ATP-binding protein
MKGIVKVYSDGTVALKGVDFSSDKGEIHGLLGENGAGKTTLMSVLFGRLRPTKGEVFVRGQKAAIASPHDAMALGIGMVHQHFMLIPRFTALDNAILGLETSRRGVLLDRKAARERLEALIKKSGLSVDLDAAVETLPVGVQQRLEILKLMYRGAEIIVLDEPTSVLTPIEVEELFKFLRRLKEEGQTVIFISHKLKEVMEITDRVTVLRKGQVVRTVKTAETSRGALAQMMVGRDVVFTTTKSPARPAEVVLSVRDLWVEDSNGREVVKGVSFEVRGGEVFGIAGVEGNGQTQLTEALTGLTKVRRGKIVLRGLEVQNMPPHVLYEKGLGHVPEDRHRRGLILEFTVEENAILGLQMRKPFAALFGTLQPHEIESWANRLISEFNVDVASAHSLAGSMSGGNQQKVICGREMMKNPSVVVASQPTRGLDVAATEYIRSLLLKMRDEGKGVLLVSADLDEVTMLSDRMAIIYEGQFVDIVDPSKMGEGELGLMFGGVKKEASK